MISVINPATGLLIDEVKEDSFESINATYQKAVKAQQQWSSVTIKEKKEIISKFCHLLTTNTQECAKTLSQEMGKPISQARSEIQATGPRIKWFLDHVDQQLEPQTMYETSKVSEKITWEPIGVIANISAWNFPYFIGTNVIIPALLTGNTVLYKPSEICPLTGAKILDLLSASGLPKNVFNLIQGKGDVGAQIVKLPLAGVFFTGSNATGKKIAEASQKQLMRLTLELGGKDPAYVCDDVVVENVVDQLVDGAYYNAGQSCCAVERIYVHSGVYDLFIDCFVEKVKGLKIGDPREQGTYMGPLARLQQIEYLEQQVNDATTKGAKTLVPGGRAKDLPGWFFRPTVVTNVTHSMDLMTKESFGPVVGIQKVSSDHEAIQLMNDTPYGLTASIHTRDQDKAMSVLSQANTGTVYWNSCDRISPYVPWTGRKASGIGSTLSEVGIKTFLQPKSWQLFRS